MNLIIIIVFLFFIFLLTSFSVDKFTNNKNVLCIYAYYEKNEEYKQNLEYFLENGLNDEMEYIFVVNGECSVNFPDKVQVIKRENTGYDFGAYSHIIENFVHREYEYYIFLNTSVKGPLSHTQYWQREIIKLLKDDVKLSGTVINCSTDLGPHLISSVFCMDLECFLFLKNNTTIFSSKHPANDYNDAVINKEVALSTKILENNWNITCLAEKYKGVDYRKIKTNFNPTSYPNGDPMFKGAYFGGTLDPNEVLFLKTEKVRELFSKDL